MDYTPAPKRSASEEVIVSQANALDRSSQQIAEQRERISELEAKAAINKGKAMGSIPTALAAGIALGMQNPVTEWIVLQSASTLSHSIQRDLSVLLQNTFKASPQVASDIAFRVAMVVSTVANTFITNPALIPVAAGVIAGGMGAILGGKIAKNKLNHKVLTPKTEEKKI